MTTFKAAAFWQLESGVAQTLRPDRSGVLRVHQGRVWATFDLTQTSPVEDAGDHFVQAGQDVAVRAGQRVVVEPWSCPAQDAGVQTVTLLWEPALGTSGKKAAAQTASLTAPPKSRPGWLPFGRPARL